MDIFAFLLALAAMSAGGGGGGGTSDHADLENLDYAHSGHTGFASSAALTLIQELIPNAASAQNQLADKGFVNSSISTNTANYISNNGEPFTSVEQLEAYAGTVTNNDYAFVTGTDEHGNTYYDRYKATVNGSSRTWAKEYRLNNSSFTAAQWSAISSGITSLLVTKLNGIEEGANNYVLPQATSVALGGVKVWQGTQAQYDAIITKDADTYYFITE